MSTIKLLIATLLTLHTHIVLPQCVSIELSITWEMGYDIFKKDSMVCIPNLHITYRNNSNENYYFLKVSDNQKGSPMFICGAMINNVDGSSRYDHFSKAKSHGNYANQNFYVSIGRQPLFCEGWEVINDSIYYGEEQETEIDFINCSLQYIYEYIYCNKKEYAGNKIYFSPSDVTPENIVNNIKDQFVFLKSGDVYVDSYNLIGFKLVEGGFTFYINQNMPYNYVLVHPVWDTNQSYWVEQKMELPDRVDEYCLYNGLFLTNSVKIVF